MSRAEPAHSVEIERSYDVDDSVALPDWAVLPGVSRVDEAEVRELDARYLDTDDLALGRARTALRRRTGGPDEGWHVKVSGVEGRHEWHWPLGDGDDVPAELAALLADTATGPFTPLARIRNRRIAYALRDADGAVVAEMVDDHVTATAERTGRVTSWREWEVELGPAAPDDPQWQAAFFEAVDGLVAAAGGRVAASDSKLARTLGL
ncbi:CYTH domain-containing protein [Microbacterium sp. SORGH_AS_0888]|uniref:CYTH domain-containing protein n=1 Tax=Microbacterium sp. SORGH_AS_0888 TaxID=3041791 RepID=UPI002782ED48|nr:CYTH domain-containing protein [Microbacterium sp. SORGH_AS_0888]MDQ1128909.1 inorganic triphosphatase YgiF [Microbacterium sp. SORGH_AS_0888]